jgi:hypothetical protein
MTIDQMSEPHILSSNGTLQNALSRKDRISVATKSYKTPPNAFLICKYVFLNIFYPKGSM